MLTRSKCMAASEAAGEKNWEMANVSDTFHPPTTVVASPDPTLAQSEPRPPNPTLSWCQTSEKNRTILSYERVVRQTVSHTC